MDEGMGLNEVAFKPSKLGVYVGCSGILKLTLPEAIFLVMCNPSVNEL
jgi:hypothetical protein